MLRSVALPVSSAAPELPTDRCFLIFSPYAFSACSLSAPLNSTDRLHGGRYVGGRSADGYRQRWSARGGSLCEYRTATVGVWCAVCSGVGAPCGLLPEQ